MSVIPIGFYTQPYIEEIYQQVFIETILAMTSYSKRKADTWNRMDHILCSDPMVAKKWVTIVTWLLGQGGVKDVTERRLVGGEGIQMALRAWRKREKEKAKPDRLIMMARSLGFYKCAGLFNVLYSRINYILSSLIKLLKSLLLLI